MAQTIIGLDVGSYSVKVSTIKASLRGFVWESYREFEIPHAGRARPEKAAAQAIEVLGRELNAPGAVVVAGLPGDRVMTRFVTLPFNDPKRIDSVLGFELEGQIPLGVEEMSYAYQIVGEDEEGMTQVFAAAVKHEYLERYLEGLREAGVDPRVLTLDTASYVNLYTHLDLSGAIAFVDIGHTTTKICVVDDGALRFARSIGRGGQQVTRAIATEYEVEFDEAERLKHERAELPLDGSVVSEIGALCEQNMRPIAMAIRQTCQAYVRESGRPVAAIEITGGGSRLTHVVPWLQAQIDIPVTPLSVEAMPFCKVKEWPPAGAPGASKSLGLCLQHLNAIKQTTSLNFRRGSYAFEGDFKFLREKLLYLCAVMAALLVVGAISGVIKNNSLQRQLDAQYGALSEFTSGQLGKRQKSFKKTLKTLRAPQGDQKQQDDFFPPMTAIAVLDKITAIQEHINQGRGLKKSGIEKSKPENGGEATTKGAGTVGGKARAGAPAPGPNDGPRAPFAGPTVRLGPRAGIGRPLAGVVPTPPVRPVSPRIVPRAANPRMPPAARPPIRPAGLGKPGGTLSPPGDKGKSGDADTKDTAEAVPPVDEHHQIELTVVDIDVFGDVSVTAETHESNVTGSETFKRLLSAEPCFSQVKRRDIGDVVSTGRHADWVRFEVTFKLKCHVKSATAGNAKAGGTP